MTQISFINSVKDGAIQGWHTHKILPSLTISQAILESGWGGSSLAKPPNNNLFGIKASPDWTGEVVRMPTQEWNGSQMVTIYDNFRVYPTANASILDHSQFFTDTEWRKNNYRAVIGEKDYRQACYAVSQAGYATDPNYPGKLINLIESYNLNRYDQEAFNGNAPPIVIPEPIDKPEPGGSDPGRSVAYSLFDTRNYVNVSKINYKDDMLISPEGESVIYNPTLNDQFVFTPKGAETMWIDQIYESNIDNYIVLMEEAINFMRERSKPEAQYTVNMKYLPDSISIGDTGQFIDHEYNPPLYIEARVLDIITSETEPEMDSVIIGNVTEIKSRYQADLLELQERLKKTREGLLVDFYKAGDPEVFIDASNGTSLIVTGTKEKKELISGRLRVTEVADSYEYEILQPEDESSEWLFFTGRILDNVIDHSEEVPLGTIESNNIVTLSDDLPENPQGEDVPYIDPALDLKELDVEQFTLELINDNGAVVQTSSVPVRIDSYFSIPVKKTSQTIDKISIKSNKPIDIENISFAEPSRATKESEFTVLTARIMQNGKDITERYGNYRWTRISENVALDDIWNERNKFAQGNSLTVYPSDIEGENSTFICRVYDGLNFVAGGSTAVTVVKALSAYEVAVRDGFVGTEREWLDSLKGKDGDNGLPGEEGKDGMIEYLHIAYSNSPDGVLDFSTEKAEGQSFDYMGTATTLAQAGSPAPKDPTDPSVYSWVYVKGDKGKDGETPYEVAVRNGFVGTEREWLESLKGKDGDEGLAGEPGKDGLIEYLHIAYSNSPDGTLDFNTSKLQGDSYLYMGTATTLSKAGDPIPSDPTDPSLYSWVLIKGEKGEQGPRGLQGLQGPEGKQGIEGDKGADGKSSYTHIAYATGDQGQSFNHDTFPQATYIGMYVSDNQNSSDNWRDYKWTLIKGKDGSQGIQGPKGADGKTPYFHTAWANSADGSVGFSTTVSEDKLYIGTYTDYTSDDSENPADYKWTKIKGEDGLTSYFHRAWADDLEGGGFTLEESLNKKFMGTYSSFDPEPSQNYQDYQWQRMAEDYAKEFEEDLKDKAPNDSVQEIINEISSLRGLTNSKLDMVAFNQQMAQYEAFLTMLDTAIKNAQALATKVDNANVEILNDLQDQAERWLTQAGYIQIDGATNTFSISNTSNNSQIIVDDEGIKFMDGGVMVGIITGQYLRIMRGIFAESVQIGKFKFEPFSGDDRRLFLSYLRGEN